MNVIARLEFELAYLEAAIKHVLPLHHEDSKVETNYSSLIWNIKDRSLMCTPGGTNHHVCLTQSSVREKDGFTLSRDQKRIRDVGEFLKHCDEGDHFV